ncbi:MAG TPA: hypothetical protein VH539_07070 [Gemmatimonadaceae bacterium]
MKSAPDRRAPGWVRSWDTDVPAGRSKAAFEELLRRYGATGFTVSEDYASHTVVVAFQLVTARETIEVHLPIGYEQVRNRLRKMPEFQRSYERRSYSDRDEWANKQAERVAWRHLLLWAEAMLSAVDAGLYSLQEAVFAFTIIDTPHGGKMPAVDAVNAIKRLTSGARE